MLPVEFVTSSKYMVLVFHERVRDLFLLVHVNENAYKD